NPQQRGRNRPANERFRDAHGCVLMAAKFFKRRILGSWLRLRSAARLLAPLRGPGLTLLIALALLTALSLTVLALSALAALFARREIGRRRLLVLANDDLCTIGQIGKAGRYHAVGGRQSARDHGIGFVLLCHHNRFRSCNVAVADDVTERSRCTAEVGTTNACDSVSTLSRTLTNCPGHS